MVTQLHVLQVFEKFTKESTSLLDELSIINESDKSSSVDKDKYVHTHTHMHMCAHTQSQFTWNPKLCVCLSFAGQLTVSSCHPLTLKLSSRLVNITSFSLSHSQKCCYVKHVSCLSMIKMLNRETRGNYIIKQLSFVDSYYLKVRLWILKILSPVKEF